MSGEHGTFYWNERMTRDVEGTKKFYAGTMGWSYDGMPMPAPGGTYWLAKIGGDSVGGIMDISGPEFNGARKRGCPTSPSTTSTRA